MSRFPNPYGTMVRYRAHPSGRLNITGNMGAWKTGGGLKRSQRERIGDGAASLSPPVLFCSVGLGHSKHRSGTSANSFGPGPRTDVDKGMLNLLIKFSEAFWNNQASKTNGYHRCLTENVRSPASSIESLFLRPGYADDTNPAKWR